MGRSIKTRLKFKKPTAVIAAELVERVKEIAAKFPDQLVKSIEKSTNNQVHPYQSELPDVEGWRIYVTDPKELEVVDKNKVMARVQDEYPALFSTVIRQETK